MCCVKNEAAFGVMFKKMKPRLKWRVKNEAAFEVTCKKWNRVWSDV